MYDKQLHRGGGKEGEDPNFLFPVNLKRCYLTSENLSIYLFKMILNIYMHAGDITSTVYLANSCIFKGTMSI